MTFNSNNPNATYTIDGIPKKGLYTEQAVVGVERVLGAPSPQFVGSTEVGFTGWSDGQAQTHTVVTPDTNASYTVNFDPILPPPAPWQETNVGNPDIPGYSSYNNGAYTVRGSGVDIWGGIDQFHFVHQTLSGDGSIVARITSLQGTEEWAKAGVMIKDSTTAGSPYAALLATPSNGIHLQYNFNGDIAGPATVSSAGRG